MGVAIASIAIQHVRAAGECWIRRTAAELVWRWSAGIQVPRGAAKDASLPYRAVWAGRAEQRRAPHGMGRVHDGKPESREKTHPLQTVPC